MDLKTKIKNDMWRINYIIPFVKRYQFSEKGKIHLIKHIVNAYKNLDVIKGTGERTVGGDTKALLNQVDINIDTSSHFVYFIDTSKTIAVRGNVLSNFTLAYDKVIHGNFNELLNDACCVDDNYGNEIKLVAEGILSLSKRIQGELSTSSHPQKNKLIIYFEQMLSVPAQHFDEGLQRILFFNQILWQTRHRLNGLGRLDKILGDLYESDIVDGLLTENLAHELVHDFLLQLSKYSDYKSDALLGDVGQIIILGGLESNGKYFYNKLTDIFLIEQAKLSKPDPKILLRVSKNIPNALLRNAIGCLIHKTGSPLFSNDDVVIPALIDFGVDKEDAYSYCTSACWEPLIIGKSLAQNNIAVFDYFVALDEVLNCSDISSFETLVECYIKKNEEFFKKFLNSISFLKWAKDPLVSLFTDKTSKNRVDISDGGCKYTNYGITTVALSNVVDSLLNIKKFVFDEKKINLVDLNNARKNNYKCSSELFKKIQAEKHHYGHDEENTIKLVNRITTSVSSIACSYINRYGGTVKFGVSSPGYNIASKNSLADVSGRKFGMPYNTHISCFDASYTEVVSFASKLDYDRQRFNGNVVDFFVNPDFLETNIGKFALFMLGAIKTGFFQMQMNVVDSKTLIDAKKNPDKYHGLIVRVWGFSAYFNDLPESYKDLLIVRACAAEHICG